MFFKYFFCSSSLFPVFLLRGTCRVNSPSCGIPSSRPQLQKKTQLNQSYHGRGMSPRHSTPLYLNTSTAPARARRTTRIFSGVPSYFEQFHSEVSPPRRTPLAIPGSLRRSSVPLRCRSTPVSRRSRFRRWKALNNNAFQLREGEASHHRKQRFRRCPRKCEQPATVGR